MAGSRRCLAARGRVLGRPGSNRYRGSLRPCHERRASRRITNRTYGRVYSYTRPQVMAGSRRCLAARGRVLGRPGSNRYRGSLRPCHERRASRRITNRTYGRVYSYPRQRNARAGDEAGFVAAYSLARGVPRDPSNLRATLFDNSVAERQAALAARIDQLEAKLRAIEEHPGIDDAALRAATTHTRLVCSPGGYELSEVDAPPPAPGTTVDQDGSAYTVWQIGPSPLPDDARRCAILV